MAVAPLTLSLNPSPGLGLLLAALYAAAAAALLPLGLSAFVLIAAWVAMGGLAVRAVRRDALGAGRGAPVGLVVWPDGAVELTRSGLAPVAARLSGCCVRLPGLAVLEVTCPESRVGVLVTPGRVGGTAWRRLRVLGRWGPAAAFARGGVNSPPSAGSVGP